MEDERALRLRTSAPRGILGVLFPVTGEGGSMLKAPRLPFLIGIIMIACGEASDPDAAGEALTDSVTPSAPDSVGLASAAPGVYGDFVVVLQQDPMTDRDESLATTEEVADGPLREGSLYWRCDGADIDLILAADEFLNSDGPVRVQWRLGEDPAAAAESWSVSTRGTGVFAPDESLVTISIDGPMHRRIRFRVTDFRGTPHDYEFSLVGLAEALRALPCGLEGPRSRIASREEAARQRAEARAVAAAAAEAREDSLAAAEARRLEVIAAEEEFMRAHPFVGNPVTRIYAATSTNCWRLTARRDEGVFFRSSDEAEAAGYRRNPNC